MRRLLRVLAAVFLIPSYAYAGAWLQRPGETLFIQNAVFYATGEAFDASGRRVSDPGFRKFEYNPYMEYGVNADWTLGASLFFQYLEQDNAQSGVLSNQGLGESELFARYKLLEEKGYALALQPSVTLPGHYFSSDGPVAGREDWDAELTALAGYGFSLFGRDHYIEGKAAYRHRSGILDDQYRLSAGMGIGISEGWRIAPELSWTGRTQGGGSAVSIAGQNDYELVKAQLSVVWEFSDRCAVQFGGYRHVSGEDTGAGGGVLLALWRRW